jgi:ATP-dependent DNA ligase
MSFFLFPPHPHKSMKIPHGDVAKYEAMGGWVAQRKFNGAHFVGHIHLGTLTCWNRQGQPFSTYKLTPSMSECFADLKVDPNTEYVFNGELLHTKAKSKITNEQAAANTIVLFDLLYAGRSLLMETFPQRYTMLTELCGSPTVLEPKKRAIEVGLVDESKLWLAEVFESDFEYRWYELYDFDEQGLDLYPEIEGLVLKRVMGSRLDIGNKAYDVNWMMRVRKEKTKTYQW